MKIELPLETWTELFGFVPRSQLIQLVPHFGEKRKRDSRGRKRPQTIRDRQFVSFIQFFLHKCGEITLGQLSIRSSSGRNRNDPIVIVNEQDKDWDSEHEDHELPLAVVPIPENVKSFKSIHLRNLDGSVITFLQKFGQNSLLDNVSICFGECKNNLLRIMTNFLPLFTNINSIKIDNSTVLELFQNEYSELALPMFTSARFLLAKYNCCNDWYCEWLHIPREDGKPRVLFLGICNRDRKEFSLARFVKHIKKDFLEANQAVSFFIQLEKFRDVAHVQSETLENSQTQEILVIKGRKHYVNISRYPMATNGEEGKRMCQHPSVHDRQIVFEH